MPTGYTSKLHEGTEQSFRDFVLTCSRAMGATIHQRDESIEVLPATDKPSDYYRKAGTEARAELETSLAWTDEDAQAISDAKYAEALAAWKKSRKDTQSMRDRYDLMLAQVQAWTPPTTEHVNLKNFMVDQIEESKRFDCSEYPAPVVVSGEKYRADQISLARRRVKYADKEWHEECARVEGRNQWIADLYASLPVAVA